MSSRFVDESYEPETEKVEEPEDGNSSPLEDRERVPLREQLELSKLKKEEELRKEVEKQHMSTMLKESDLEYYRKLEQKREEKVRRERKEDEAALSEFRREKRRKVELKKETMALEEEVKEERASTGGIQLGYSSSDED